MNDDVEIIKMAKEDIEHFDLLYKKYAEKVYNFFFYRVGKKHDIAEDLRQETFIRALKALHDYQMNGSSYLTYLLTVAHNILVNYYRYNQLHNHISIDEIEEADDPVASSVSEDTEKNMKKEVLWKCIANLPLLDKKVFFMRYERQMHIKEIAPLIQKTENAVKLMLLRIRRKLMREPTLIQQEEIEVKREEVLEK